MKTIWAVVQGDENPDETLCGDKETARLFAEYGLKDYLAGDDGLEDNLGTVSAMRLEWRDDTLHVVRLYYIPGTKKRPAMFREDAEPYEIHLAERTIFETFDELVGPA